MPKLTKAQLNMLRRCSGDKSVPKPRSRWQQEQTVRALIARDLVSPIGWILTPAGRAALAQQGAAPTQPEEPR